MCGVGGDFVMGFDGDCFGVVVEYWYMYGGGVY